VVDKNGVSERNLIAAINAMNRIHIRRALLGLDAPTKLDVRGLYAGGSDEASERSLANQRAWANLSRADQERLYEALKYPAIETTATVTSGTDDGTESRSRKRGLAHADLDRDRIVFAIISPLYIRLAWHVSNRRRFP
jgi:hypothetical protein